MKKAICLLLTVLMLFPAYSAFAEEETAAVVFTVSEEQADGRFTVTVTIHDAVFYVFQSALLFDPSVVCLVDKQTGEPSDSHSSFADIGQEVQEGINLFSNVRTMAEDGLLYMALMVNMSQDFPNAVADESMLIHAPAEGVKAYTFYFKRLKDGDPGFAIATQEDERYDESIPEGLLIADGEQRLAARAEFVYPDKRVEDVTVGSNPIQIPQQTEEEKREQRKKDTVVLQIGNYAAAVEGVLYWIEDGNKQVVPYIEPQSERTFVPLRFIAEKMGAEVLWEDSSQTITIKDGENTLEMQIGDTSYKKNGEEMAMDARPVIGEGDRTFVPLRFVSEGLEKSVLWVEASQAVIVSPAEDPWTNDDAVEQKLFNDCLFIMSPMIRDMI